MLDLSGGKSLDPMGLADALRVCRRMVHLSIASCKRADDACLVAIASSASRLRELNLSRTSVADLSLLCVAPLRASLRQLLLAGCRQLPPSALAGTEQMKLLHQAHPLVHQVLP